jgi:hypothetical protein
MKNKNKNKVKPKANNYVNNYGQQNQNNMPVFSYNQQTNNIGYNEINGYARQAQQNTQGTTTMSIKDFKNTFRKKYDAHY